MSFDLMAVVSPSKVSAENPPNALGTAAHVCASWVLAVGLLVLLGWATGSEALKRILPEMASMKANTALCFVLCGTALLLRGRPRVLIVLAGAAGVIALVSLGEDLLGWHAGIDQVLFQDDPGGIHARHPGRMSIITAVSFLLSCTALIRFKARRTADSLALVVMLVATLALLGYLFDLHALDDVALFSSMALHTAGTFLMLAVGILLAQRTGVASRIFAPTPGGQMLRRLATMAVLFPPLVGWLCVTAQSRGWISVHFGAALTACATILFFSILVWTTARRLDAAHREHRKAEEALRQSEAKFAAAFANNPAAIALTRFEDGMALDVNETWARLLGEKREEVLGRTVRYLWPSAEDARRFLEELQERGVLKGWEQEFRKKSGERFFGQISAQMMNMRGEKAILTTLVDITARKQAEEELNSVLRHSRTIVFRSTVEAPEGWDQHPPEWSAGRYLWTIELEDEALAKEVLALKYMSNEEFAAAWWRFRLPEDQKDSDLNAARAFLSGAESFTQEYRCADETGRTIHFLETVAIRNVGHGRWKTVAVNTDITERKQAQEQLEGVLRYSRSIVMRAEAIAPEGWDPE